MEKEMSGALTVGQATFSKIRIFCIADAEVPRFTDTDLMEKTWRPLATFTKFRKMLRRKLALSRFDALSDGVAPPNAMRMSISCSVPKVTRG